MVKTLSTHRRRCGSDLLSGKLRSHMLCAWYRAQPKIKKKQHIMKTLAGWTRVKRSGERQKTCRWILRRNGFPSGTSALYGTQPWKRQRVHRRYSLLRRDDPKLELLDPYSETRLYYLPSRDERRNLRLNLLLFRCSVVSDSFVTLWTREPARLRLSMGFAGKITAVGDSGG